MCSAIFNAVSSVLAPIQGQMAAIVSENVTLPRRSLKVGDVGTITDDASGRRWKVIKVIDDNSVRVQLLSSKTSQPVAKRTRTVTSNQFNLV